MKTKKNMHFSYLVTVVFFPLLVIAQTYEIKGKVVDQTDNTGISGVVISNYDHAINTLTNEEGEFVLRVENERDQLFFNHIRYQVHEEQAITNMLVKMELSNTEIDEILIFKRSLNEVFSLAFKNVLKMTEKGDLYKTYIRQFNRVNDSKVNIADGIVDFYVTKPNKRAYADVLEHRVFLSKEEVKEDSTEIDEMLNTFGGDVRDFLILKKDVDKLLAILKETKSYDYAVRKKTETDNSSKIIVTFEPKDGLKDWLVFQGYIVFDESQTKILEYKYELADKYIDKTKTMNLLILKMNINKMNRYAVFTTGEQNHLFYSSHLIDMTITAKAIPKYRIEIKDELMVNKVYKDIEIPQIKLYKGHLYKRKSQYTTEFWKNRNLRPLSNWEQQIVDQLALKLD